MPDNVSINLFIDKQETGASNSVKISQQAKAFQASVSGTGAVSATVVVQVSNDIENMGWLDLATITLSGTTSDTDGFTSVASWVYHRGLITAIAGTGAAVNLGVGV